MKTKITSRRLMVLAALLTVVAMLGVISVPKADASCGSYSNSSIAFFALWGGWACAYTGPGCSECVYGSSGGYTVCLESGGRQICWDYPAY